MIRRNQIPEFNLVPKICNFSHMLQKSFMAAPQVVEVERYFNVFSLMSLGISKFKVLRFKKFLQLQNAEGNIRVGKMKCKPVPLPGSSSH